jgi:hypothetical protein
MTMFHTYIFTHLLFLRMTESVLLCTARHPFLVQHEWITAPCLTLGLLPHEQLVVYRH